MADEAPEREIKNFQVDGTSTTYLSPDEQAREDRRQAEHKGLKRRKSLNGFFRIFKISTQDRP